MNLPKISIVVPVLNREDTLEKALQSIFAQHYDNIEIIIIDGGSTDGTIDIIKYYEKEIAYWHSHVDGSSSVALNFGIGKATGDLVATLMADDWYEPGTFKKIAASFAVHPEVEIFTCAGRIVTYDEKAKSYRTLKKFTTAKSLDLTFSNVCFAASAICCRFIRSSLFTRVGVYNPYDAQGKHRFSNDKEFLLRTIVNQAKNIFVDHLGYNYLAHQQSATFGNNPTNIMRLCAEHMEMSEALLSQNNLSKKQRFLLHYWYNDQSARLLAYKLLAADFPAVWQTLKDGLAKYHLIWLFCFGVTACRIVKNKSFSWTK